MRFDILTLFPSLFAPFLAEGVTRRAFVDGPIETRLWPLRNFGEGVHLRVDDRPYGGGPGMVMLVEPLERALAAVRAHRAQRDAAEAPVIHFSPIGRRLDQALVRQLAGGPGAILVCSRYEGVDQRFIDANVDLEISLGDFVLSGGELPAIALLDAVARLLPGVLHDARSPVDESFEEGLLEGPHYSRPERLQDADGAGRPVPAVLLSGHHSQIRLWRRRQAIAATARRRPDLLNAAREAGRLSPEDEACIASLDL